MKSGTKSDIGSGITKSGPDHQAKSPRARLSWQALLTLAMYSFMYIPIFVLGVYSLTNLDKALSGKGLALPGIEN